MPPGPDLGALFYGLPHPDIFHGHSLFGKLFNKFCKNYEQK